MELTQSLFRGITHPKGSLSDGCVASIPLVYPTESHGQSIIIKYKNVFYAKPVNYLSAMER